MVTAAYNDLSGLFLIPTDKAKSLYYAVIW